MILCVVFNVHYSLKSVINFFLYLQLLGFAELKLKEAISKEPTLLIMLVGVPNVGKSALINSIHRIATSRFPGIIISEEIKSFFIVCDSCLYCCISSER